MPITVTIITKNESDNIRRCLDSVKWADEIVVLDSGSTDHTVNICKEYTDKVIDTDWPGFGPQKNRAIKKASNDWILSLDADEALSETLQNEIQKILTNTQHSAYRLPRFLIFNKKIIKYGHGADKVVRLFNKHVCRFTDDLLHEKLIVEGSIGNINSPLFHYSFSSIEKMLVTMNRYSTLGAKMKTQTNKRGGLLPGLVHGMWMFLKMYIFKRGFLDGREGFMLAVSAAEGSYYRYVKMIF